MIWLMLATLLAVFVVGFRVLTSENRRAVRALSSRLVTPPVYVESLINQMGKTAGEEFVRYLATGDENRLRTAANTLFIWQVVIVNPSEQHLENWFRILKRARLAGPISDGQLRQILSFLRAMEPDREEIDAFRHRYNALFVQQISADTGQPFLH